MSESEHETKSSDEAEDTTSSEHTSEDQGSEGSGYDSAEKEPGSDRGRGASEEDMVQRVESEGFDIDQVEIDDRDHTEDDESDIEEERKRRLDPENRPENAEVDNTQRTFDAEKGVFEDSPDEAQLEGDPSFKEEEEAADSSDSSDSSDDSDQEDSESQGG
jgi:hypothetical protein